MGVNGSAVVTGAGRGIGRALALELAGLGYPVALQGRTVSDLDDTRRAIEARGGRGVVVPGDVREAASAVRLVEVAGRELGPVSVAVGNAGQALSLPLLKTRVEDLSAMLEVNLYSAFHLTQAAAAAMLAAKTAGRIVIVASTAAVAGMRYTAAYAASKHAVLGLVRTAALELAHAGITVNALCPGWVETEMFDRTLENIAAKTGGTVDAARERITSRIPMREVLAMDEVAALLAYVVSERARHLTGQALVVDGGETL